VKKSNFTDLYQYGVINKILRCLTHCLLTENCPGLRTNLSNLNANFAETDGSYIKLVKSHVKVPLSPVLPDIRMSMALFGGTQASAACLNKCNIKTKLGMEHWWNDTDRRKRKYPEKTPSQYHFLHHISHVLARYRTPVSLKHGTALENLY
jgi:hypothetical protein